MFNLLKNAFTTGGLSDPERDPTSYYGDIYSLPNILINFVMGVSFSIALISIVYSGFLYANSSGDPKRAKKASDTLLWGVVAFAITLGALTIKYLLVGGVFGVPSVPDNAFISQ